MERVEFGGFGDSWKGMIDGSVDAAFASTNSGRAYEAESGPRGVYWPPIDPENAEGFARMAEVAPFFSPMVATVGAGIDGTDGAPTAGFAYPVLMTYAEQDADLVYNMTKAMFELLRRLRGEAPGIDGWALDQQTSLGGPVPRGCDPLLQGGRRLERGGAEAQRHAHRPPGCAAAAWEELKAEDPDDWEQAWEQKRRDALSAGGFSVVF